MGYIGNTPADKFLTLAKQNFSTSATTSYTLDSAVSSTQDIALFINNVRQSPVDAYTVSGTSLTLSSATAGTDEMYCVYLGKTVGTVSPASDSVTTAMLQANAVTGAKLNTDVISAQTALGATPADTDELLVSDAGVLKRVDYSYLKTSNTPYFFAYRGSSVQSIANNTLTVVEFNAELYDSGSCFDTGTYKFTPNVAGKYLINATVRMGTSTNADNCQIEIFKNTTTFSRVNGSNRNYSSIQSLATIDMNGSSDYIQAKIYQDTGGAANIQYNSDSTYQTFLQGFFIGS